MNEDPTLELALDPGTRRLDAGRLLIGGSPLRALRLSAAGSRLLDRWLSGQPVPDEGAGRALAERLVDAGVAHPLWACPTPTPEDVTVVIPVRDDVGGLASTLAAVGDASPVVVVDDGSRDADAIRAVVERTGALLVRRERSGGPGAARQQGRSSVDTPLIAFVDADCRPEAGWLDGLLPHLVDPRVVAVAPRIRSEPGVSVLARYEMEASPLDLGGRPASVRPGSAVSYVPTAALLVRADAPPFDPALRYGEDVDLIWRIVERGGVVRYEPAVTVWHRPRRTWREWLGQRRAYGSSAAPLSVRHGTSVAPVAAPMSALVAWGLLIAGRPVIAASIVAATTVDGVVQLRRAGLDDLVSVRVALDGQVRLAEAIARGARRAWWPVLVLAIIRRRWRAPVFMTTVGPLVMGATLRRRSRQRPLMVVLQMLDEVAYGVGLWGGCITTTTLRPLLPRIVGRRIRLRASTA